MADVFVFGSNLAGRHGAGAAKVAREKHGAVYGQGYGRQGNSFAIPTKDGRDRADLKDPKQTLSLDTIRISVEAFKRHAMANPDDTFHVTPIGCGLAGYRPDQIGPLFEGSPTNVTLPKEFVSFAPNVATQGQQS